MSEYNESTEDTREVEAMRKMFIGGLNKDTADEVFFDYFGKFGNMVDKVVIKDPHTKASRGFGFITYSTSEAVENVFKARPHELAGRAIDTKRAMPREFNTNTAHAKCLKLFIGGVGPDIKPDELRQYIESRHDPSIGTVKNIEFITDKEGKNKGFGFLECSDFDFADRLTISENKFAINGKTMSLKKAVSKDTNQGMNGERSSGRGRGSGRGSFRGNRGGGGGSGGRGFDRRGDSWGPNRGGFNNRNGGGNNYNNQYQQQHNGNYGGGFQQQYPSYNQNQGYNQQQGGAYQANQYGNTYNQNQGYNQGGYDQSNNQPYPGNQNYGGNQTYGGGNQQPNNNNRYAPY